MGKLLSSIVVRNRKPLSIQILASRSYSVRTASRIFNPSQSILRTADSQTQTSPISTLAPHLSTTLRSKSTNIPASRIELVARHLNTAAPNEMSRYSVRKVAQPNTLEHRIYIEKDGVPCSPFHDIPLYANEQQNVLNMIVEIPRWTNGKLEV